MFPSCRRLLAAAHAAAGHHAEAVRVAKAGLVLARAAGDAALAAKIQKALDAYERADKPK